MRRFLGIACGLLTQALFLATLPPFTAFCATISPLRPPGRSGSTRRRRCSSPSRTACCSIPPRENGSRAGCRLPFYGLLFCAATCVSLWIMFAVWRGSPVVVWAWPKSCSPAVESRLFRLLADSVLQSEFDGPGLPDGSDALVALGARAARSAAAVSSRRTFTATAAIPFI